MTESHLPPILTATLLLLAATASPAQTPAPNPAQSPPPPASATQPPPALPKTLPNFYRNLIVIDPAHGGPDRGAQLANGGAEKDVTLAFAQRLRPALVAQGFTVVSTRDSDPTETLANDQRAGTANHLRPLACLILHATTSGKGVHIATSSLEPSEATRRVLHWTDAQASAIEMSLRLSNEVGLALLDAHLPAVLMRTSVPPVDNLTCAASILEIAPLATEGGSATPPSDASYQQKVAEAVALGLANFRNHNAPPPAGVVSPAPNANPPRTPPGENKPATPTKPQPTPATSSPTGTSTKPTPASTPAKVPPAGPARSTSATPPPSGGQR